MHHKRFALPTATRRWTQSSVLSHRLRFSASAVGPASEQQRWREQVAPRGRNTQDDTLQPCGDPVAVLGQISRKLSGRRRAHAISSMRFDGVFVCAVSPESCDLGMIAWGDLQGIHVIEPSRWTMVNEIEKHIRLGARSRARCAAARR